MDRYDENLKQGLTDHLEESVPAVDLWASVQERLVAGYRAQGDAVQGNDGDEVGYSTAARVGLLQRVRGWFVPYAWGAVGLVVLVLVMTAAVAGFGNSGRVTKPGIGDIGDVLFTIPTGAGADDMHWIGKSIGISGFAVDEDGTFWVGDADWRALHYGKDGKLISMVDLTKLSYPESDESRTDLRVTSFVKQGDHFWVLGTVQDSVTKEPGGTALWEMGVAGDTLSVSGFGDYTTVQSGTQTLNLADLIGPKVDISPDSLKKTTLQVGGNGEILAVTAEDKTFYATKDPNTADFTAQSLSDRNLLYVQLLDRNGVQDIKVLDGYPSGDGVYGARIDREANGGRGIGYVKTGIGEVEMRSDKTMLGIWVQSVAENGSFYVVTEEMVALPVQGQDMPITIEDGVFIRHYSADGRLLEWGRMPRWLITSPQARRMLASYGGDPFYALNNVFVKDANSVGGVEVQRIRFFDGDQALPTSVVPTVSTPVPGPTTIAIVPQSPDYDYVFTVQGARDPSTPQDVSYSFGNGFDVAEDGSFWVGLGSFEVVHYAPNGKLINKFDTTASLGRISDLEVGGGSIWVVQGAYVYRLSESMAVQERFEPIMSVPGTDIDSRLEWLAGSILRFADGQMILEQPGDTTYLRVANQTIGTDGNRQPPPLAGYPGNGIYYYESSMPAYIGNPIVIMAGDAVASVGISMAGQTLKPHILKVLEDGSFYVVVESSQILMLGRVPRTGDDYTIYVNHYDATGKLLEYGRIVTSGPQYLTSQVRFYTGPKQIAMGPDGNVYAEGMVLASNLGGSQSAQQGVVRVKFYPADEPLPTLPAANK